MDKWLQSYFVSCIHRIGYKFKSGNVEGTIVNDRTLAVLEKYDLEVLRSWKGRGAILCETKTGIKILKEYKGSPERLMIQQQMLEEIKKKGFCNIEKIIPTKEGEVLVKDEDMNSYYLKDYFEGKECNIREVSECSKVAEKMAKLHKAMELSEFVKEKEMIPYSLPLEFEKHNRELRHVKKYLKSKRQKNEFEYFLYQNFHVFLQKAEQILAEIKKDSYFFLEDEVMKKGTLCHGDFQHHNVLFSENEISFINFEKYVLDHPMRDLSLFFRKMMEKHNWCEDTGRVILLSYQKVKPFSQEDKVQLYYRLSYPEKFWKIVNFYYGASKVWIPAKNMEKLEKILQQEKEKNLFLEGFFREEVLRK